MFNNSTTPSLIQNWRIELEEVEEKELKAAGTEPLPDGRRGLDIHGRSKLTSSPFSPPPTYSCHIAGFCVLCAIQKHASCALQSTGRILAPNDFVRNLQCISWNF
ncbi:hypothetical protein CMV_023623 [Castanea mollissima]|uniref:Uncharacterized protein n=1 Tax=Castanea mollissima TaxID=60419 RepID=A0A8J4VJ53_9ROSI|nr:hypothetical protein CMV_023623 [Castanea mollissima]